MCLVRSPSICCVLVVDGCGGNGFDECGCVCGIRFVTDVVVVVGVVVVKGWVVGGERVGSGCLMMVEAGVAVGGERVGSR